MNISGENIRKSLVKVFEFGKSIHVVLLQEAPEEQKEPEKSEKAKDMVHLAFSRNHRNCPHPWLSYRWNVLLSSSIKTCLGCQVFRRLTKEYVPVSEALAEWTGHPAPQHRSTVSKGWLKVCCLFCQTQEGHSGLLWLGIAGTIWSTFPNMVVC